MTAADTAAIMADPDYQAWATGDEAAPAPAPAPAQTIREWADDPADTPMPAIDPRSLAAVFSVLTVDEINVITDLVKASNAMTEMAGSRPEMWPDWWTKATHREMWLEGMKVGHDLHEAWLIAFERENPGNHKSRARQAAGITCKSCGASGTHLTAVRHKAIGDTEWTTDWHCTDVRACHDRSAPGLAAILDPSGAPGPELDDEDRGAFTTYLACGDSLSDDEPHAEGAPFTCPRHGETSFITLEQWKAQHPPYDPADPFA